MNILDILCKAYNWQGGTIHNAIAHFATLEKLEQDHIFNTIMDNLSKITDLDHVKTLSKIRISHLTIKGV